MITAIRVLYCESAYVAVSCSQNHLSYRGYTRREACMMAYNSYLCIGVAHYVDIVAAVIARYSGHACN